MIKEKKNPTNTILIDRLKCINDFDDENIDTIVFISLQKSTNVLPL